MKNGVYNVKPCSFNSMIVIIILLLHVNTNMHSEVHKNVAPCLEAWHLIVSINHLEI